MLCLSPLPGSSTTPHCSGSLHLGTIPDLFCHNVHCLFPAKVGQDKCLLLLFRLRTVDAVIITHSHADAIGGLRPLLTLLCHVVTVQFKARVIVLADIIIDIVLLVLFEKGI